MSMEDIFDDVFEVMIRRAVMDNLDDEIEVMLEDIKREGPFPFSARHERRMKRIFARTHRKDALKSLSKWSKRVAAAVLIFAALLFGSLMLVPNVRAAVVDTIVEWYDEFTQFIFGSDAKNDKDARWEIAGLQQDYSMTDSEFDEHGFYADYSNLSTGDIIMFDYKKAKDSFSINNEEMDYSTEINNGITYHFFINESLGGLSKVVWDKEGYRFQITATLTKDDIFQLARSIRRINKE